MSSSAYAQAKLYTDVKMEQEAENQYMQDLYDIIDQDQALADEYGLGGQVAGGVLGFIFGGFEGAKTGMLAGKQARFFAPEEFDESMFTMEEGKFGIGRMKDFEEDTAAALYDYEMGEYTGALSDALSAIEVMPELDWGGENTIWSKYLSEPYQYLFDREEYEWQQHLRA